MLKSPDKRKTWRHWSMTPAPLKNPLISPRPAHWAPLPPPTSSSSPPHTHPVISFRIVTKMEECKKGGTTTEIFQRLVKRRDVEAKGTNQTLQKCCLPFFFFFCWNFLLFSQTDGIKTRTQTGTGNMISVPLSSGSRRKWYFIDRTSSYICSDWTDRENAQINVRLCACQCARVCFTGKNNQPNRKIKPRGWWGRVRISRCAACGCCGAASRGEKLGKASCSVSL